MNLFIQILLKLNCPHPLVESPYLLICGLQRGKHYPGRNLSIISSFFTENDINIEKMYI